MSLFFRHSGEGDKIKWRLFALAMAASAALFIASTAHGSPLHDAVEKDRMVDVEGLIEEGYRLEEKNDQGRTPLHVAAEKGRLETVRLLVDKASERGLHGLDYIRMTDGDGFTAEDLARLEGHDETGDYLRDKEKTYVKYYVQAAGEYLRSMNPAVWIAICVFFTALIAWRVYRRYTL